MASVRQARPMAASASGCFSLLRDRLMRAEADGDGRVTKNELRAARQRAGLPAD